MINISHDNRKTRFLTHVLDLSSFSDLVFIKLMERPGSLEEEPAMPQIYTVSIPLIPPQRKRNAQTF